MKPRDLRIALLWGVVLLVMIKFFQANVYVVPETSAILNDDTDEAVYNPSSPSSSPSSIPKEFPFADKQVEASFGEICTSTSTSTDPPHRNSCILQKVALDPNEKVSNCAPFKGGENRLFGLNWCAWPAHQDGHISKFILDSKVPPLEVGPMGLFRSVLANQPRGIVIDAGAHVGLFSAAALSEGHYTISIDARPEHVQMNAVSRRLNYNGNGNGNGTTAMTDDGLIVHGALSDRCGQWATIPREVEDVGNPGSTHIVGRISDGWPLFPTQDEFYQVSKVPILTLDHIMEHVWQNLPSGVERKVYALKIDIEGFEPRALMGATRLFSHFKPDIIIMELFAHRFKDCDAKKLILAIAELGYIVDVSARLNLSCPGSTCSEMKPGSEKLAQFLTKLTSRAEMDVTFRTI